jgi:hypothetical protein
VSNTQRVVVRVLTSARFAIVVSIGALVGGSACFAATTGTPAHWIGVLASSVATGLSGMYVGTAARLRIRNRSDRR